MLIDLQKEGKLSKAGHDPIQNNPSLPRASTGQRSTGARRRGGKGSTEKGRRFSTFQKGHRVCTSVGVSLRATSRKEGAREHRVPSRGRRWRALAPSRGPPGAQGGRGRYVSRVQGRLPAGAWRPRGPGEVRLPARRRQAAHASLSTLEGPLPGPLFDRNSPKEPTQRAGAFGSATSQTHMLLWVPRRPAHGTGLALTIQTSQCKPISIYNKSL